MARDRGAPYHAAMNYEHFVEDCRIERAALADLIEKMEKGQLGIGHPITLPRVNEASANLILSVNRSIADLDALIQAYEDEADA